MNKLMKLLSPFMKFINVGIAKAFVMTIALNIGFVVLFNSKPDDLYISALALYSFIGIIFSLGYSKQMISSNLSWMLSLPYSKLKLIGISLLLSIYIFFVFFISIILFAFISYFISFKTFHIDWINLNEINPTVLWTSLLHAFSGIDTQILAGINAFSLFFISLLFSISNMQNNNSLTYVNSLNLNSKKTQLKSRQIALGIIIFGILALQIDKVFSPMNIIFGVSLISAAVWKSTCTTIIDESKRAKVILYSIIGYVLISNSIFAIKIYYDSLNRQNPIMKRIDAYHYLGLFAPSIEQELQDELNKSSANKVDIDLLMAIDGQDPERLLESILKAPYQRNNFDSFIQDRKIIYHLDANKVDLAEFMSDEDSDQYVKKLGYLDFSQLENSKAIKFLNDYVIKYKYLNYNLCWYISHKKLSEDEIKSFLNSDQLMPRYCGLVLSRYYPTYDFTQSLIQMAKKKNPLEFQSLFITTSIYQGALMKADELYKLNTKNFFFKKVDCPGDSAEFVKRFKALSYSQQVKCPRFYMARTPINNAGMDNIDYVSNPVEFFNQRDFENSARAREKEN